MTKEFIDSEGCCHESFFDLVWIGELGFCGCGNPEDGKKIMTRLKEALKK